MICVLIGVVPSLQNVWENIIKKERSTLLVDDDDAIEWRDYSTAIDDGKPTLLIEALTEASAEAVLTEVTAKLKEELIKSNNEESKTDVACELWATAPAPLPLRPLEGYENIVKCNNDKLWIDWSVNTMQQWGIIVQDKIIDSKQLSELSHFVNKAISVTESQLKTHRPDITVGKDFFCFKEIASRNLERFDLRLKDDEIISFVEKHILGHSNVNAFLEHSLGKLGEIDFDVSVVYSRPGACTQGWHADGSHQNGANDAGFVKDGWKIQLAEAYAICLFLPLISLNDEVGYTQFWPGSHRSKNFVGFGPVAEITGSTFDGKCNAGDGVWYDYRLIHRGMPNNSDMVRPVLQVIFKKKWYIERANYGDESIVKSEECHEVLIG